MRTVSVWLVAFSLLLSPYMLTANYILVTQSMNSNNAQTHCQQNYGTTLASIHDETDNQQAADLCEIVPSCIDSCVNIDKSCHIGLNDKQNEREKSRLDWLWYDGTPYDYQNWRDGETQNEPVGGSESDCVVIFPSDHSAGAYRGAWADIPCTTKSVYFLCNAPPTNDPTKQPTENPTKKPTNYPTNTPTNNPTEKPSNNPTNEPTHNPSQSPSKYPSLSPSSSPTLPPSKMPTNVPTFIESTAKEEETSTDSTQNTENETISENTTALGSVYFTIMMTGMILCVVVCVLSIVLASCYYQDVKRKNMVIISNSLQVSNNIDVGEKTSNKPTNKPALNHTINATNVPTHNLSQSPAKYPPLSPFVNNTNVINMNALRKNNIAYMEDHDEDEHDNKDLWDEGPVLISPAKYPSLSPFVNSAHCNDNISYVEDSDEKSLKDEEIVSNHTDIDEKRSIDPSNKPINKPTLNSTKNPFNVPTHNSSHGNVMNMNALRNNNIAYMEDHDEDEDDDDDDDLWDDGPADVTKGHTDDGASRNEAPVTYINAQAVMKGSAKLTLK